MQPFFAFHLYPYVNNAINNFCILVKLTVMNSENNNNNPNFTDRCIKPLHWNTELASNINTNYLLIWVIMPELTVGLIVWYLFLNLDHLD